MLSYPEVPCEAEILWLHNPEIFPFVREGIAIMGRRQRNPLPRSRDGRVLIAQVLPKPISPTENKLRYRRPWRPGYPLRRFWYLMPYDYSLDQAGRIPSDAVDPLSIVPGQAGYKTDRCYIPPTPQQREQIEAIFAARRAELDAKSTAATQRQRIYRQNTRSSR